MQRTDTGEANIFITVIEITAARKPRGSVLLTTSETMGFISQIQLNDHIGETRVIIPEPLFTHTHIRT